MTKTHHTPVLLAEVIQYLKPRPGGVYLDGTLGGAGHSEAILRASAPDGRVVGLDRDPAAIVRSAEQLQGFGARAVLRQSSYTDAAPIAHQLGIQRFDGILLDLGLSSDQLADPARGFSFQVNGPLDLRFNPSQGLPAAALLSRWTADELARILGAYGELRAPRRLAEQILAVHRDHLIMTTDDLVTAAGLKHPRRLSQLFQAFRIATNDELGELERALPKLWDLLAAGGRLVALSFHSLEDRIVKRHFRAWQATGEGEMLTKRPDVATPAERAANPRSRSAKLRAIERSQ